VVFWSLLRSHVQIANVLGVGLNEPAARGHFRAHQHVKSAVCFCSVFDVDAQQGAIVGVHRGFPELVGVHFTQAPGFISPKPL